MTTDEGKIVKTAPEHEVVYQELLELLDKHGAKVSAYEMLAIAGNMVGKIIAMQPKELTIQRAMEVVMHNIVVGNQQARGLVKKNDDKIGEPQGSA